MQVTARAERDLQRLLEKIVTACVEFIFGPLADNPHTESASPSAESSQACTLPAEATTE